MKMNAIAVRTVITAMVLLLFALSAQSFAAQSHIYTYYKPSENLETDSVYDDGVLKYKFYYRDEQFYPFGSKYRGRLTRQDDYVTNTYKTFTYRNLSSLTDDRVASYNIYDLATAKLREAYALYDSGSEVWSGFNLKQGRVQNKEEYDASGIKIRKTNYKNEAFYDNDGNGSKELGRTNYIEDYPADTKTSFAYRTTTPDSDLVYYKAIYRISTGKMMERYYYYNNGTQTWSGFTSLQGRMQYADKFDAAGTLISRTYYKDEAFYGQLGRTNSIEDYPTDTKTSFTYRTATPDNDRVYYKTISHISTGKIMERYYYFNNGTQTWGGFTSLQGRIEAKEEYSASGVIQKKYWYKDEGFYDYDGDGKKELGRIYQVTDYTDPRGTVIWTTNAFYKDLAGNETDYAGKKTEKVNGVNVARYEYFYDDSDPANWKLTGVRKYCLSGTDTGKVIEFRVLPSGEWKPTKQSGGSDPSTYWWYYNPGTSATVTITYGSANKKYTFYDNIAVQYESTDNYYYIYSFNANAPYDNSQWTLLAMIYAPQVMDLSPDLPELPPFTGQMAGDGGMYAGYIPEGSGYIQPPVNMPQLSENVVHLQNQEIENMMLLKDTKSEITYEPVLNNQTFSGMIEK